MTNKTILSLYNIVETKKPTVETIKDSVTTKYYMLADSFLAITLSDNTITGCTREYLIDGNMKKETISFKRGLV